MRAISNKRTSDYIVEVIQNEILSGRMTPNQPLRQEELAESLGASRIPIREALHSLENIGMVKRLATRHIVVADFNDEVIREIYEMICDIEMKSISNIIRKVEIKEMWIELEALKNQDVIDEMAFHKLFIKYMNNEFLVRLLENKINSYIRYAIMEIEYDRRKRQNLMKCMIEGLEQKKLESVKENIIAYYSEVITDVISERRKN